MEHAATRHTQQLDIQHLHVFHVECSNFESVIREQYMPREEQSAE
jgi:hypothetical protein